MGGSAVSGTGGGTGCGEPARRGLVGEETLAGKRAGMTGTLALLESFFDVEIRNERHGGASPSTLGSALDSWDQAPDDVLAGWCGVREPELPAVGAMLEHLAGEWGPGEPLDGLVYAIRRGATPPGRPGDADASAAPVGLFTPFPRGKMPADARVWPSGPPYGRVELRVDEAVGRLVHDTITGEWFRWRTAACGLGCRCAAEVEWVPPAAEGLVLGEVVAGGSAVDNDAIVGQAIKLTGGTRRERLAALRRREAEVGWSGLRVAEAAR